MGKRKIKIRREVAEEIAKISFFIESKGVLEIAEKFTKPNMNFLRNLNFDSIDYPTCRKPQRAGLGLKCIPFNKKYTIVSYQMDDEVIKMDLLWDTINKECKYWTDRNAKAAFVTNLERELPADILSTRDFEWIAPKEYWTEAQFQNTVIDLYKAGKLEKVKDALDPNRTKTATQIETFFRAHFKVCCP